MLKLEFDYISKLLLQRARQSNAVNDLWNCKEYNYQMAQYHAYVWFGKLLNFPVFDLMDFVNANYSLDDMHVIIASKIDRAPINTECVLPTRCLTLTNLLAPLSEGVLIYDYSKK